MSEISVVEIKRQQYTIEVIQELYKSGANTIAQLAKKLHTSVPSITEYVNDLISIGWLQELGSVKTQSGRRPTLFDINPDKHQILVVDLNLHNVSFSIINLRNEILSQENLSIDINEAQIIEQIVKKAKEVVANKTIWAAAVISIGLINSTSGLNLTYLNLNRDEKSLAQILEESLNIPTQISHDTIASIVGEHDFGLAKDRENVLVVNIDWGIGLGIICNGNIITGAKGFAGELGHIQIKPDGKLCNCGKKGCLETVASAEALIEKAKEGISQGKATILSLKKEPVVIEDIISAALNGDEYSIDLIIEMGNELGKGLSIAIHLFNPEIIVIHGILTNTSDLIISTLKQSINKFCILDFKKELEVVVSPISKNAKIFGAKSLVFNKMLKAKAY